MPFVAPAARFEISCNHISVLKSPTEFRETLISKLKACKSRCILTSLYIGAEQTEIMDLIAKKAQEGLEVWTMTDYLRTVRPDKIGSKGISSSAESMLETMAKYQCPHNWKSFLYLTPCSYNWQRWFPYRMQETLGVLHWKFYIFDNDVILTGANIASSYLTNRHDRWMLIENYQPLCDALDHIGKLWHPCCYRLRFDDARLNPEYYSIKGVRQTVPMTLPQCHLDACLERIEHYLKTVQHFTEDCQVLDPAALANTVRLSVGIHCGYGPEGSKLRLTEPEFVVKALRGPKNAMESELIMATPYCNLAPETISLLSTELGDNRELCIVGPSPNASSFFNGGPVLSAIPFAYVLLTLAALEDLRERIKVKYRAFISQASSTFHAKGIWHISKIKQCEGSTGGCALNNSEKRVLTIAGSTNFGRRSQNRDLECLFLLDTSSEKLVTQLEHEAQDIKSMSREDTRELDSLRSGLHTLSLLTWLIARFFSSNPFFRSLL